MPGKRRSKSPFHRLWEAASERQRPGAQRVRVSQLRLAGTFAETAIVSSSALQRVCLVDDILFFVSVIQIFLCDPRDHLAGVGVLLEKRKLSPSESK